MFDSHMDTLGLQAPPAHCEVTQPLMMHDGRSVRVRPGVVGKQAVSDR